MNAIDDRICKLIDEFLEGRVDAVEFWRRSKEIDGASPSAAQVWHQASHYVDDADIRERDANYARDTADRLRWQLQGLKGESRRAAE